MYCRHGAGKTNIAADEAESFIIQNLHNDKVAFIYHCYNHYCVPIGYDITSNNPQDAYRNVANMDDCTGWLFIGDSSKTNRPIFSAKLADIRTDLQQKSPYYFNIRHVEDGIQQRKSTNKPGDNLHCFMIFESGTPNEASNANVIRLKTRRKAKDIPVEIFAPSKSAPIE